MEVDNSPFLDQFTRLKRHELIAREKCDLPAMKDLAHILRVWTEMKREVDQHLRTLGASITWNNAFLFSKQIRRYAKDKYFFFLPVINEVQTPGIRVRSLLVVRKAPPDMELIREVYGGRANRAVMSFTNWLGVGVCLMGNLPGVEPSYATLSRQTLIKRTANIFGGSHPDSSNVEDPDRRFDPFIKEMSTYEVANGYPATYFSLLEIANCMITAFEPFFGEPNVIRSKPPL